MKYNLNKTNLIYIRVDSSIQIGSGHVERCLTLSKELVKKDMKVHFICRSHIGNIESRIRSEGFEITMLPVTQNTSNVSDIENKSNYKSWLGANWEEDAHDTSRILLRNKPALLILDHYDIDINWENLVKSLTGVKIMVIDGLANRHHNCEFLLDYTFSFNEKKRWDNLIPSTCKLLLGTKYTLLRSEFIKAKKNLLERKGEIKRILIAFGGSDKQNATSTALDAVDSLNKDNIFIDVVIGNNNPHINQIQTICNQKTNVQLHIQSSNIAILMSKADLSIGAGGTMLWERCYLGLPSLLISIADNQIRQSAAAHSYGAAIDLGVYSTNIKKKIIEQLKKLINDKKMNLSMSHKSFELMNTSKNNQSHNPTKFVCDILLNT